VKYNIGSLYDDALQSQRMFLVERTGYYVRREDWLLCTSRGLAIMYEEIERSDKGAAVHSFKVLTTSLSRTLMRNRCATKVSPLIIIIIIMR
jgi:hypothetical protein